MTLEQKIEEILTEYAHKNLETYGKQMLTYLPTEATKAILEAIAECVPEEYQIHELHKECGKTTDGKQLYWAKVNKRIGKE